MQTSGNNAIEDHNPIDSRDNKNRTTVASIHEKAANSSRCEDIMDEDEEGQEERETKAVSNSNLWGDLAAQSTTNSHLMSQSRF